MKSTDGRTQSIEIDGAQAILDKQGNFMGIIEGEASAKRIVACINACEGIPTDVLEHHSTEDYVIALLARLNYSEKVKAELLEALQSIYIALADPAGHNKQELGNAILQAIAKAEGGPG